MNNSAKRYLRHFASTQGSFAKSSWKISKIFTSVQSFSFHVMQLIIQYFFDMDLHQKARHILCTSCLNNWLPSFRVLMVLMSKHCLLKIVCCMVWRKSRVRWSMLHSDWAVSGAKIVWGGSLRDIYFTVPKRAMSDSPPGKSYREGKNAVSPWKASEHFLSTFDGENALKIESMTSVSSWKRSTGCPKRRANLLFPEIWYAALSIYPLAVVLMFYL